MKNLQINAKGEKFYSKIGKNQKIYRLPFLNYS